MSVTEALWALAGGLALVMGWQAPGATRMPWQLRLAIGLAGVAITAALWLRASEGRRRTNDRKW